MIFDMLNTGVQVTEATRRKIDAAAQKQSWTLKVTFEKAADALLRELGIQVEDVDASETRSPKSAKRKYATAGR